MRLAAAWPILLPYLLLEILSLWKPRDSRRRNAARTARCTPVQARQSRTGPGPSTMSRGAVVLSGWRVGSGEVEGRRKEKHPALEGPTKRSLVLWSLCCTACPCLDDIARYFSVSILTVLRLIG